MKIFLPLFLLLSLAVTSCVSPSANSAGGPSPEANVITTGADLTNYLKRIAGVRVTGTGANATVQIRGGSSLNQETSPLFVVDGNRMGNDYGELFNFVSTNDIAGVTVLKGGDDTSFYGLQGANGVIEITLKK